MGAFHFQKEGILGQVKLTRTGQRPLEFTGEIVAEADSRWSAGRENNRWHELALYKTESGKYVLAVDYQTQWEGEHNHHDAWILDSPVDVESILTSLDPCEHMESMPSAPQFQDKDQKRRQILTWNYKNAVSELLSELPEQLA